MSHFPIGSAQPAWVALFREGHYQLFYNEKVIRIFIKKKANLGYNQLFSHHKSVIRHPLLDLTTKYKSIEAIEVYGFNNNYKAQSIKLNTIPTIINIDELDLSIRKGAPDIEGINNLLISGVDLMAIEVDDNDDLYFYGMAKDNVTLDGKQISISDLAVIYRSIFHHYENAPYISLDKNEDNRFAKVNFGGHLQNTRVGQVVLDADKMFKTLGTGLYNENLILDKFRKHIPNFLSEAERGFLEPHNPGKSQIRYWFYPDSIGTVTDGSIGALTSHYFLADVERMDKAVSASNAIKNTIKHLNDNYSKYESAHSTFKELSTVGKIMGLVNWLKGLEMENRVDLDKLLSVMIPAHRTERVTKKLLTANTIAYVGTKPTYSDVMNNTRIYNFSHLLDENKPSSTDDWFLELASTRVKSFDWNPKAIQTKINKIETLNEQYTVYNDKAKKLKSELDYDALALNRYDSWSVDSYNQKVNKYNKLINEVDDLGDKLQRLIEASNLDKLQKRIEVSVGGGINLRPQSFKQIKRNSNSKALKNIKSNKNRLIFNPGNMLEDGFIRNEIGDKGSNINDIPSYVDHKMFDYSQ